MNLAKVKKLQIVPTDFTGFILNCSNNQNVFLFPAVCLIFRNKQAPHRVTTQQNRKLPVQPGGLVIPENNDSTLGFRNELLTIRS